MKQYLHMKTILSTTYKLLVPIFLILNLVALSSLADDLKFEDIKVPSKLIHDGKTLVLNGASYRKVGFIRLKVWLSALYLEKKSGEVDQVINSNETKIIVLHPLYDVSAADSVKGWRLSLDEKCDESCKKLKPEVKKFLDSVPEFKIKDRYIYVFTKVGMSYSVNDKLIFKSENRALGSLILSTWIGARQNDKTIEKNMMGHSSH